MISPPVIAGSVLRQTSLVHLLALTLNMFGSSNKRGRTEQTTSARFMDAWRRMALKMLMVIANAAHQAALNLLCVRGPEGALYCQVAGTLRQMTETELRGLNGMIRQMLCGIFDQLHQGGLPGGPHRHAEGTDSMLLRPTSGCSGDKEGRPKLRPPVSDVAGASAELEPQRGGLEALSSQSVDSGTSEAAKPESLNKEDSDRIWRGDSQSDAFHGFSGLSDAQSGLGAKDSIRVLPEPGEPDEVIEAGSRTLPSSSRNPSRIEPALCGGQVLELQQGPGADSTTGKESRSWQASSGDTFTAKLSNAGAQVRPESSSKEPDHGGRLRGLSPVPAVPGQATPGSSELRDTAQVKELGQRQRRQLTGCMKRAEKQWSEMMSCLCGPEPDALIEGFKKKAARELQAPSRKQKQMYQEILQCSAGQLRTVAEIFNPNRFGPRARRHHLRAGRVFDLELGSDLLKRSTQQSVLDYLRHERPGLVIISPPCSPFSSLNNLLKRLRQKNLFALKRYLHHLKEGRALLHFAIEACQLCDQLGLKFVLEHPLGASSWGERRMLKLLQRPHVQKVTADQCVFELRSLRGNLHKKPTAFATNHGGIAETLSRRCQGGHVHEHILGDRRTSRRSEVYPRKLVDAILQAYARSVGRGCQELHHLSSHQLLEEDQRHDQAYFTLSERKQIEAAHANCGQAPSHELLATEEDMSLSGGFLKDMTPEAFGVTEEQLRHDGWHQLGEGRWIFIAEDLDTVLAPEDHPAKRCPWRTSWVRVDGQWRLLEDEVRWENLHHPCPCRHSGLVVALYSAKIDGHVNKKMRHFPGLQQVTLEKMLRRAHEGLGHPESGRFVIGSCKNPEPAKK